VVGRLHSGPRQASHGLSRFRLSAMWSLDAGRIRAYRRRSHMLLQIMKLTKQVQKVFNYIRDHRGCTTRDIQQALFIECTSARIT
jgi:hypothetical protein